MCTGDKSAFSQATVDKSTKSLLTRMGAEDVFGDAPKAADWVCTGDTMLCMPANNIHQTCPSSHAYIKFVLTMQTSSGKGIFF